MGLSFRRSPSPTSHFEGELQKLDCFVNYNISSGKGRSWKCGWVWYQSAQARGKAWGSRLSWFLCQVFSVVGSIVFLGFQVF